MCGRYTLATPGEELLEVFDVPPLSFTVEPRYNVAPGQDALVVAQDTRGRRIDADVAAVHDRMPAVIPPGDYEAWLDRATPVERVLAPMRLLPEGSLRSHGVPTRVNAVTEDDPGLVEPTAGPG